MFQWTDKVHNETVFRIQDLWSAVCFLCVHAPLNNFRKFRKLYILNCEIWPLFTSGNGMKSDIAFSQIFNRKWQNLDGLIVKVHII